MQVATVHEKSGDGVAGRKACREVRHCSCLKQFIIEKSFLPIEVFTNGHKLQCSSSVELWWSVEGRVVRMVGGR